MFLDDRLREYLEDLTKVEKVSLWNRYCDANGYYDDKIYFTDIDLETMLENLSVSSIFHTLVGNDLSLPCFVWGEDFETGDLQEFFETDDIIEYIIRQNNDLGDNEIRDILDEEDEILEEYEGW